MGGHLISALLGALGPVSSLSSTLTSLYPTLGLLDNDNQPTGKTTTRHNPDQVAFTGLLASGATVNFQIVTGASSAVKSYAPFRWTVIGENGTVDITGDSLLFTMVPSKITVNGEPWEPEAEWNYLTSPIERGWEEFAKGDEGKYSSFEDAVKIYKVVEAINTSHRDGARKDID